MLGNQSLGILYRDAKGLQLKCGNCGELSPLRPDQLPATIPLSEIAAYIACPACSRQSAKSSVLNTDEQR